MALTTIHHVGMEVDDLDAARAFYTDVLGMSERSDRPEDFPPGMWLNAGDRRLNLAPTGQSKSAFHLALVTDDIEGAVARLRAEGVAVRELQPPLFNVMFQDPWGNWIELRRPPQEWVDRFGEET